MSEFIEIWKTIEGFGERYEVSSFGSVRDTWRGGRILPQFIAPDYSRLVELVLDGNKEIIEVSKLLDKYFNVECVIGDEEPKRKRKTKGDSK